MNFHRPPFIGRPITAPRGHTRSMRARLRLHFEEIPSIAANNPPP